MVLSELAGHGATPLTMRFRGLLGGVELFRLFDSAC